MTTVPYKEDLSKNIKFDLADKKHIQDILEIEKLSWFSAYPNEEVGISKEMIEERFADSTDSIAFLEESVSDPKQELYLISLDNDVVGYLHLQEKNDFNDLVQIYLLPEFQGQGVGNETMKFVVSKFGSDKPIHLQVASYNQKAISLYKKFGFQVSDLPQPPEEVWNILPSGVKIPVVVMVKN